jgi:pimeloyl-ACP methyl ester carboxylesterase
MAFANLLLCSIFAQSCTPDYGFPVQKVQAGSNHISYTEYGKGKPLILIHGLGGNAGHWRMNQTEIGNAGYRVIAVNLPGYGESGLQKDIAPENQLRYYAAVVDTFMQTLQLHDVSIAGHSMGAQVSMLVALTRPRWLKNLIWIAPAGLETFSEAESRMLEAFATPSYFKNQDSLAIVKSFNANFYTFPGSANALVRERVQFRNCPDFEAYTQQVSAGVRGMLHAPVANLLHDIDFPVLLITAENDALIPNRALHPAMRMEVLVDYAIEHLKNITHKSVPKAGHMVQWESYEQVNSAIIHFLNQ